MIIENIAKLTVQFWWIISGSLLLLLSVVVIVPFILIKLPVDYFSFKENKGIINKLTFGPLLSLASMFVITGLLFIIFGFLSETIS